jgi:hypothetical protein
MQLKALFNRKTLRISLALSAFVAAPARAQIAVLGNTVEERVLAPGEAYVGTIVIRNVTQVPQPVRVYQTDYTFQADGTSHFDEPGTSKRSNAKWITTSSTSLVLAPSSELTLSYSLKVPTSDSLSGTYWSAIMIEAAPTGAPAAARGRVGLAAVLRYAIQISTQIRETGSRTVSFVNQSFVPEKDGSQTLQVDISNTGDRAYHPSLWVELYDSAGAMRTRVQQQRGLLYPGTSLRQSFALGKLPPGTYKAVVFADIGDDTISAAQYQLKF